MKKSGGFRMRIHHKQGFIILLLSLLFLLGCTAFAQAEGTQIAGAVWLDKTPDGKRIDEQGFADVKIFLEKKNADGEALQLGSVKSARNGSFAFAVESAGEYRLRIELPKDYQFTLHGLDSAALPAQENKSYTPYFSVNEGESAEMNIGVTKATSYISIYAFEDTNLNGGRMQSEPKIRGVELQLLYEFEGETYLIASAATNRDGEISIRDLSAGTYTMQAILPDNYVAGPLGQKLNGFYNCFLPGEGSTAFTLPFTLEPKGSVALGVGTVRTGSLKGQIWFDDNANGKWDSDSWETQESGLHGAKVTMTSASGAITRETFADEKGNYAFFGLQPGDYTLTVTLPDGMLFTYSGSSFISTPTHTGSVKVKIEVETTTSLKPIGAVEGFPYSVSMLQNYNTEDGGVPFPGGASLSVYQDGVLVSTHESGQDGEVLFHLRPGEAILNCQLPEGYIFEPNCASEFTQPIGRALSQHEAPITVQNIANETAPGNHSSIYVTCPAGISGFLFDDPANMGVYQEGYSRLSGFKVQAVDGNGTVALETETDENGEYSLFPLLPGTYAVHFLLNDPYVASPYAAEQDGNHITEQTPDFGRTDDISLEPGQMETGVDAAVFRAGTVEGFVLLNPNHDNLATNEGGMEGVTVTLLDEYGAPCSDFAYDVTDENGYFMIKGILPGAYSLLYTMPEDGAFTSPMTDDYEVEGESFVIGSGSEIHADTLGGVYTSTLSGHILDAQDEPVFGVITMTSRTFGTVYETETMEDGHYAVYGMRPDTYDLSVTLPEGYVFGMAEDAPITAVADNEATAKLEFEMGDVWMEANLLAARPASLSGTLFYDADRSAHQNGEESGAEERYFSLWLRDKMIADLSTDEKGSFHLDQLIPGNYTLILPLESNEILVDGESYDNGEWIVNFVVDDGDDAHIQVPIFQYAALSGQLWSMDGSLSGVSDIEISLLDSDGFPVDTAYTDEEGYFDFSRIMPGEYSLMAELPEGFLFAREQDAQDQASYVQSMPDGTPLSLPFTVSMGDDISGLDIGMGAMGRIGDRAWLDENGNGMQDIGEPNMPGILIELYQHGELIASTVTDVYGLYTLSNLYPGEYEMHVTMHKELKATLHQAEFPLVASIMPESDETTVVVTGIIVPSGGKTLHYDLGFLLRKKGVYPAAMDEIPVKDWRPYTER